MLNILKHAHISSDIRHALPVMQNVAENQANRLDQKGSYWSWECSRSYVQDGPDGIHQQQQQCWQQQVGCSLMMWSLNSCIKTLQNPTLHCLLADVSSWRLYMTLLKVGSRATRAALCTKAGKDMPDSALCCSYCWWHCSQWQCHKRSQKPARDRSYAQDTGNVGSWLCCR